MRSPVSDDNLDEYCKDLSVACRKLSELIRNKHRVYLFCTAGQSRSPTLSIIYMCLCLISKNWSDPDTVFQHVQQCLRGSIPNIHAVRETIRKYHDIEKESRYHLLGAERRRLDDIAKQEERKLWARRDEYLQVEREERRRKEELEREKKRQLKIKLEQMRAKEESER